MSKTLTLRNEADRKMIMAAVTELPADGSKAVRIVDAGDRSLAANRLAFAWYKSIGKQTGDDSHWVRCFCKLTFGVPILCEHNDDFSDWCGHVLYKMSYPTQIDSMVWIEVTRLFTVKQFTQYLTDIEHHYGSEGISLPHPEDAYYEAMGYTK